MSAASGTHSFSQNFSHNYVGNNYGGLSAQLQGIGPNEGMRAFLDPTDEYTTTNYHQMTLTQIVGNGTGEQAGERASGTCNGERWSVLNNLPRQARQQR